MLAAKTAAIETANAAAQAAMYPSRPECSSFPIPSPSTIYPEMYESVPPHVGGGASPTISNVAKWGGNPDKHYLLFITLSILTGFLGWDHFYIRSFNTGMMKFGLNIVSLGLWYWWDLIQIFNDSDKVRQDGLSSPFDWICGIGQGVFVPKGETQAYTSQKSYLIYAFLAIFLGCFGLDKLYMGSVPQAMAKFFSIFSIIFTLFGILWALWDSFHALFLTDSILNYGITAPLPYSLAFGPISSDAFKVTNPLNPASGGAFNVADLIPEVPVPVVSYKKDVMPLVAPAIGLVQQGLGVVNTLKQSAQDTFNSVQQQVQQSAQQVQQSAQQVQQSTQQVQQSAQQVQQSAQQVQQPTFTQTGGGLSDNGPGPVIAGVLTAVVIAGGLKGAYDYLRSR
jgi:TM2 domain-containing membrane protein YozV